MPMICETCGERVGAGVGFDYCAVCGRNLCAPCMQQGCCGLRPARSGRAEDFPVLAHAEAAGGG